MRPDIFKSSIWLSLKTVSGRLAFVLFTFFMLAGSAQATNYFNWGLETSTMTVGGSTFTPNYTGIASRDCTVFHSGLCAMKVVVAAPDNNNGPAGVSAPNNDLTFTYPWSVLGSPAVYYRWWMKIQPGFSWGLPEEQTGGHQLTKANRVGTADTAIYTGFLHFDGFSVSECGDNGCLPNSGGDRAAVVSKDMTTMDDGLWHEYIVMVKPNTQNATSCPGQAGCDAQLAMWVDGAQQGGTITGWTLYNTATHGTGLMQEMWAANMLAPYWQISNTSSVGGGTVYFDDYSVDDQYNSLISSDTTPPAAPTGLGVQ